MKYFFEAVFQNQMNIRIPALVGLNDQAVHRRAPIVSCGDLACFKNHPWEKMSS
jgi:hypothetical protein